MTYNPSLIAVGDRVHATGVIATIDGKQVVQFGATHYIPLDRLFLKNHVEHIFNEGDFIKASDGRRGSIRQLLMHDGSPAGDLLPEVYLVHLDAWNDHDRKSEPAALRLLTPNKLTLLERAAKKA